MEKKKMDDFTKFKLVYSGELLLFAVVFLVLGILFLCKVIVVSEWKQWVFPILTFCGGIYFIVNLILYFVKPIRRLKNSIIDLVLPLPASMFLLVFDVYAIISNVTLTGEALENYKAIFAIVLGSVLSYYGAVYVFEGIYHFFVPSKALTYAYAEAEEKIRIEEEKEAEEARKKAEEEQSSIEEEKPEE